MRVKGLAPVQFQGSITVTIMPLILECKRAEKWYLWIMFEPRTLTGVEAWLVVRMMYLWGRGGRGEPMLGPDVSGLVHLKWASS